MRWGAAPCAGSTVDTPPCGPRTGTTQRNASPERGWPSCAPFPWSPGCSRSSAAGELWKWPLGPRGWALASPSRVPNGLALFRNRCNGLQSTAQSPGDQPQTSSDGHQRFSTTASISLALLLPHSKLGPCPLEGSPGIPLNTCPPEWAWSSAPAPARAPGSPQSGGAVVCGVTLD